MAVYGGQNRLKADKWNLDPTSTRFFGRHKLSRLATEILSLKKARRMPPRLMSTCSGPRRAPFHLGTLFFLWGWNRGQQVLIQHGNWKFTCSNTGPVYCKRMTETYTIRSYHTVHMILVTNL